MKPILIAHRGNIDGPNLHKENTAEYLKIALDKGYHIEVDVWSTEQGLFFGHDRPVERADLGILGERRTWCHAKNLAALDYMLEKDFHCFFHENDPVTLTSWGYMWTFPGQALFRKSICVMPEVGGLPANWEHVCAGVCTDRLAELDCTACFDCMNLV